MEPVTIDGRRAGMQTNGNRKARHDTQQIPIAVVGLAGRFPGDAINPQKLWDMCCKGESAWSPIPASRFNAEAYFHPDPSRSGCFNARGGHFLKEDVGKFDAAFFGISPNEAIAIDPQQRLLLETTYEALENAGISIAQVADSDTGVYVGASAVDYSSLVQKDIEDSHVYQATGTASNILSNRISYVFDLKGPSLTIDTACSSSLAALHTACQSLKVGEIDQAIVCGSHLMVSPDQMVGLSMIRLFSESGRCYTYDSRGTGYGRGEGVVSLVLKPLDVAINEGDSIRAVIRNTGANQDGKTAGITYPSVEAQAKLMRKVYASAGLDPLETGYVEAHGTGTAAGDPVEAEAISRVFCEERPINEPLVVGSVKTNIGHLEAASGLAAIAKVILALENDTIPPNINFEKPNEDIPLEQASICNFGFGGTNVHVILEQFKEAKQFTQQSSNGLGYAEESVSNEANSPQVRETSTNGVRTNGDLAVGFIQDSANDDADPKIVKKKTLPGTSTEHGALDIPKDPYCPAVSRVRYQHAHKNRLFVFSGHDKSFLERQMSEIVTYLDRVESSTDPELIDRLAFTLGMRRSSLDWKAAFPATTLKELKSSLETSKKDPRKSSNKPRIGFVFTGQGAQWHAMGRELLTSAPFECSLRKSHNVLQELGAPWSLIDELRQTAEKSCINRPCVSQPATTAIQIALVDLLSLWGIRPSSVVGHSSGEIAAAYAAGILSQVQSIQIAYHRGRLAEALKERRSERPGGMIAVGTSASEVRTMLDNIGIDDAVVACINSPCLVTVSGNEDSINRVQDEAEKQGLMNRKLKVGVAYHSSHMHDIASEYSDSIADLTPSSKSDVVFHSSVRACKVNGSLLNAQYWVENMTNLVDFVGGIESMYKADLGPTVLIEIGPHSALKAPLNDITKRDSKNFVDFSYLPTLIRNQSADLTMTALAGSLYESGCKLDFAAVNQMPTTVTMRPLQDLPTYAWNHSMRYWLKSRVTDNHCHRQFVRNDLLGSLVDDYNKFEPKWRNILRLTEIPWLKDHKVQGAIVLPFTAYLCIAIEAMRQYGALHDIRFTAGTQYRLNETKVMRPMMLSKERSTEISMVLRPREEGSRAASSVWKEFSISSWTSGQGWTEHCHGLISLFQEPERGDTISDSNLAVAHKGRWQNFMDTNDSLCQKTIKIEDVYSRMELGGLEFGPMFRNITSVRATKNHSMATVSTPDTSSVMPHGHQTEYLLHPCAFDACFQAIGFARYGGDLSGFDNHVPTFIKAITIRHGLLPLLSGKRFEVHVQSFQPYGEHDTDLHAKLIACNPVNKAEIFAEVEGFVATSLHSQVSEITPYAERGLCHQISYQPDIDLIRPDQFTRMYRNSSEENTGLVQLERLEGAAFYYMQSNLPNLTDDELELVPLHLQKYYRFCKKMCSQKAKPWRTPEWDSCTYTERKEFIETCSTSDAYGRLVASVGENLESIIRGHIEPLSIMMRDGMLSTFYRDSALMIDGYESAANIVDTLAFRKPTMRIIELGAGTGGATLPILTKIGRCFYQYDFTDISTGFFESAKEQFQDWGNLIQYRRLNIEEDPIEQGFDVESYDLVIASFVLHATVNLEGTMRNVRKLLRPGGKVLFGETIASLLSDTLIFGTLPGWWLGKEAERANSPNLTVEGWHSVLQKAGFTGCDGTAFAGRKGIPVSAWMISSLENIANPSTPIPTLVSHKSIDKDFTCAVAHSLSSSQNRPCSSQELLTADLSSKYGVILTLDQNFWYALDEAGLQYMQHMFASADGILWVTRGARSQHPAAGMLLGLARSIRAEHAGLRLITLDLDGNRELANEDAAGIIAHVYNFVFNRSQTTFLDEDEYYEVDGIIHNARILEGDPSKDAYVIRETQQLRAETQPFHQQGRPLKLELKRGQLDSIHFVDDKNATTVLGANEVDISIRATGMNFKDLMLSLGQIPFYHELGIECSGIVTAVGSDVMDFVPGDRVCALTKGAYANRVRTPSHLIAKLPAEMDFVQAATIPVIFCTAYYALYTVGRLEKGESILIHAASGGVGQACIIFAQLLGAEVFVTVGTTEKKDFIQQKYHIEGDHVFSSRNPASLEILMSVTKQRGVDVIVNSTAGEILHQSFKCLAPTGRFIEIGKRDITQNSNLEMEKFADSVTFAGIDLGVMSEKKPRLFKQILEKVMALFERNVLRPVSPITVYPISEIQKALRTMQGGKHLGKIVIEARDDDVVQALPLRSPNLMLPDKASYLITGGTGGLGRSMIKWLANQGAKHIITASRSGLKQRGISQLVAEMERSGVQLVVKTCDVSKRVEVENLISECSNDMPPVRGVIHGAMAIRDAMFEIMTYEDWSLNTKPRVDGALNLHETLSSTKLDFFIMLASLSGFNGIRGQAAYAASNTFLDAFAAFRITQGLPAAVIDIGIVEEVGYVAENMDRAPEMMNAAHDSLTEAELLSLVKAHLTGAFGNTFQGQQTVTGVKLDPKRPLPPFASVPMFAHVAAKVGSRAVSAVWDRTHSTVRELIKQATTKESARVCIEEAFCKKLSSLLMLAAEDIDREKPIVAYGLDSLVAVELRNWITCDLEATLPLMELMNSPSISHLVQIIASKSRLVQSELMSQPKD